MDDESDFSSDEEGAHIQEFERVSNKYILKEGTHRLMNANKNRWLPCAQFEVAYF